MKFPKRKSGDVLTKRIEVSGGISRDMKNSETALRNSENIYVDNGTVRVRPPLSRQHFLETQKSPTAFYSVDGVTAVLTTGDTVRLDLFDKKGRLKKSATGAHSVGDSVLLLDGSEARLMYVKNSEGKTSLIEINRASDVTLHELNMESHAYVPTVAVGGTGYLYENDDDPIHYDFNGRLYEDKNLISNSHIVRQTVENGKNVYTLPYAIEEYASVGTRYRDNRGYSYLHGFETLYDGSADYDTVIDDVDELRVMPFSDCRNAIAFSRRDRPHSKSDSPVGCLKPNDFRITLTQGIADTYPCRCTECAVFDNKNVKTWIIYGGYYKNAVYMTGYGDKCYFPQSGELEIGAKTEAVTAVRQVGDRVAVLKENSVWLLDIETGGRYTEEELMSGKLSTVGKTVSAKLQKIGDIGCDCPKTAVNCEGRLIWLNSDGKVRMLTDVENPTERHICELSHTVEGRLSNYTEAECINAMATFCGGKYYLVIGNDLYVLDLRSNSVDNYTSYADDLTAQKKMNWFKWDIGYNGVSWRYITAGDYPVLYGDVNGGYICCSLDGNDGCDFVNDEFDVPIKWSVETSLYDMGRADVLKRSARLEADVFAEEAFTASVVTESGCDGHAEFGNGKGDVRVNVKGAEKSAFIGAKFEGSGYVRINDITLSAIPTTQKA